MKRRTIFLRSLLGAGLALALSACLHLLDGHLAVLGAFAVGYALARLERAALALALVFVVSCAPELETSTHLAIAPSAEANTDAILEARDALNAAVGIEVFTVHAVDSEGMREGEAVLGAGECSSPYAVACTFHTPHGVAIHLRGKASARTLAHELGHAAGLEHVDDPANLMFPEAPETDAWTLNAEQLEQLRKAAP
jgi:hypothetical protein